MAGADWNEPDLADAYADVISILRARDVDAGTLFVDVPTNPVTGMIRYLRASDKFQEYNGSWSDLVLAIAGGGTGAANAGDARTALGIGTMGIQNANAIAVTGGTLSGITALSLSGNLVFASDDAHDIGTKTVMARNIFAKSGSVCPVGADKWVTA
jgi:hypothetical protein